eukprot:7731-Heterococcus_DN1.PRE.2
MLTTEGYSKVTVHHNNRKPSNTSAKWQQLAVPIVTNAASLPLIYQSTSLRAQTLQARTY